MFNPQPVILQRGALRLEPLGEADITELSALAEANRDELVYMSGPLRPDWYRQGLAEQREGQAVVFAIRLGDRLVGTSRFADFMPALPAVEIQPRSGVYDYAARYTAGETEFFVPARITAEQEQACAAAAVTAHDALGLRHWSRADFIVTDDEVVFLEANVAPGMTETSLFPQAASAAGMTLGKVAASLVALSRS